MKLKDLFANFTGDNFIEIYDEHSFETHKYHHIREAIDNFGYYTVKEWNVVDNMVKIKIRTQF